MAFNAKVPTMNVTPYITGSASAQKPYEDYWDSPVYNMLDADDNGVPDNPSEILYFVPTRTGQKDNYNLSVGISATWSNPMDKDLQQQCKDAAQTNIALQQQLTANKRLDFEIARLKKLRIVDERWYILPPKITLLFYLCRRGSPRCQ